MLEGFSLLGNVSDVTGSWHSQEKKEVVLRWWKTVLRFSSQLKFSGTFQCMETLAWNPFMDASVAVSLLNEITWQIVLRSSQAFCLTFFSCMFTEIQKNGGDDKSKGVERNPSNILPGKACYCTTIQTKHTWLFLMHSLSFNFFLRRVLYHTALQPVRGSCCLSSVCGWQSSFGKHYGPGSCHHGSEKHPESLLHAWCYHRHHPSAAGTRYVWGRKKAESAVNTSIYEWCCSRVPPSICAYTLHEE